MDMQENGECRWSLGTLALVNWAPGWTNEKKYLNIGTLTIPLRYLKQFGAVTWVLQLSNVSTSSSTLWLVKILMKGSVKIIEKRWEASEYFLPPGRWHRFGLVCPPGSVCWGGWWWCWHSPGLTWGWSLSPRASRCWPRAWCGSCGQSPGWHSAPHTLGWSSPRPPGPLSAQSSGCKRMYTARSPPQRLTLCTQFSLQGSRFLCQQSSWLESPLFHRQSQILECRPPLPRGCFPLCSCI